MPRSPGQEAGFVPRSTPHGSLRLIRAVAASLVVAVGLLSVIVALTVASTQSSLTMPLAN